MEVSGQYSSLYRGTPMRLTSPNLDRRGPDKMWSNLTMGGKRGFEGPRGGNAHVPIHLSVLSSLSYSF